MDRLPHEDVQLLHSQFNYFVSHFSNVYVIKTKCAILLLSVLTVKDNYNKIIVME